MAEPESSFTPALFAFLRELRANNDRAWFQRNKQRYEDDVRAPVLRFIADVAPAMQRISRHIVADPRPVGGSMFRINRDTRFSKDKSPYKTNAAMSFAHALGHHAAGPGYYMSLAPDDVFAGGGIHMPDTAALTRIRDAIVADARGWKRVVGEPSFAPTFTPTGEMLKRAPAGYDPEHPCVEDLKRKSHIWHVVFTEADACAPDFLDRYVAACRTAAPFQRFLAEALGVPW
jgi:uncharacterized protein (TIGR02453 family)